MFIAMFSLNEAKDNFSMSKFKFDNWTPTYYFKRTQKVEGGDTTIQIPSIID